MEGSAPGLKSQSLVEEVGDLLGIGRADEPSGLASVLEGDERALIDHGEGFGDAPLLIEIHLEHFEPVEFRIALELDQDRFLLLADRAPGGVNLDEDRRAGGLRGAGTPWM